MKCALEEARRAEIEDEVPIGAVIVHDDKILARGRNRRETSGRTIAHAEIEALLDYNQQSGQWRLPPDSKLYVTVEPCMMCAGAFLSARVTEIYFGCEDTKNAGLLRITPWISENVFDHIPAKVLGGVLEADCKGILSSYFKKKRRTSS